MIMLSDDMSSHDEFMEVICGVCARKGAYSRKRDGKRSDKLKLGNLKPNSDRILELIHTHHYSDYVIGSCPTVVCASCVLALEDAEKNGTEAKRKLPDTDYSQFRVPRRTRASECCTCRWWWVGRLKGQQYTIYCKSVRNKRGRPRTSPAPTDTPTPPPWPSASTAILSGDTVSRTIAPRRTGIITWRPWCEMCRRTVRRRWCLS